MIAAPGVRMAVTGAIVAGGASSRFDGQAKGLLPVGGQRIIDRIADALRAVAGTVAIISNAPDANEWLEHAPVWHDERGERASVVGIHTALLHADAVLVVAWDMPFVTGELMRAIVRGLTPQAGAVVPEGPRGPEPLCALYTHACLETVERAITEGDLRMTALVERLPRVHHVPLREIEKLGDPARLFFNVNTPDDLRAAQEIASR